MTYHKTAPRDTRNRVFIVIDLKRETPTFFPMVVLQTKEMAISWIRHHAITSGNDRGHYDIISMGVDTFPGETPPHLPSRSHPLRWRDWMPEWMFCGGGSKLWRIALRNWNAAGSGSPGEAS